jgi:hypothetical protein
MLQKVLTNELKYVLLDVVNRFSKPFYELFGANVSHLAAMTHNRVTRNRVTHNRDKT